MKPARFDYARVDTVREAVDLRHEYGDTASLLAGGQSLIAMLNMRVVQPRLLIDISRIESAQTIEADSSHVAVRSCVRQIDLERWPALASKIPLVAQALPWVGHVQTRSRGTVCGSIAHADPSSELPLCLVVLEGSVVLASRKGKRTVAAEDFFKGLLQTDVRNGEVISEVQFPTAQSRTRTAFNEMAVRHGDFAIIAVGVVVSDDAIRIGIGGAADRPMAVTLPNLKGPELEAALNELAWSLDCQDDLHASAAYRRHLIRKLGQRTIEEARK